MPKYADLHLHSIFSDGNFTPAQLVEKAKAEGLCAIALADHDTVEGILPAEQAAEKLGLEIIPAVEFSAEASDHEVHIIGYFLDWQKEWFLKKLAEIRQTRLERIKKMISKLQHFGLRIELGDVLTLAHTTAALGRPHLALALYQNQQVTSLQDAFDRYLGDGKPCYIKKFKLLPEEIIAMIHRLKGISVLAHPVSIKDDKFVERLIKLGLEGIEVYHPDHPAYLVERYRNMAENYNLLITGGSDCHGTVKTHMLLGKVKIPYELVEKLKKVKENKDEQR